MNETRAAIVSAGSALVADGQAPSVAEAAQAAGVSRATAYRYFPNQESLVLELGLPLADFEEELRAIEDLPLPDRARATVEIIARGSFRYQDALRELLRAQLGAAGQGSDRRPALRAEITVALLRPLREELSAAAYDRLAGLMELLMGIESVVVLSDIAKLSEDDAVAALGWAAHAIVSAQLAESERGR